MEKAAILQKSFKFSRELPEFIKNHLVNSLGILSETTINHHMSREFIGSHRKLRNSLGIHKKPHIIPV